MSEFSEERRRIDAVPLLASTAHVAQPLDARSFGVSSALPVLDVTAQGLPVCDTPIQTLPAQQSIPMYQIHAPD